MNNWHNANHPGWLKLAHDVIGFDPWNREHWDAHTAAQATQHHDATEQEMNERLSQMAAGRLEWK